MCAVVLFSFIHICIGVVDSIVNGGKGMPNTYQQNEQSPLTSNL
jgi:hypothetical protein